jgi:hypothetical protein
MNYPINDVCGLGVFFQEVAVIQRLLHRHLFYGYIPGRKNHKAACDTYKDHNKKSSDEFR